MMKSSTPGYPRKILVHYHENVFLEDKIAEKIKEFLVKRSSNLKYNIEDYLQRKSHQNCYNSSRDMELHQ